MVREISWSHNLVILEKCKDDQKRSFISAWSENTAGQSKFKGNLRGSDLLRALWKWDTQNAFAYVEKKSLEEGRIEAPPADSFRFLTISNNCLCKPRHLTSEFGKGFSKRNLELIRKFYTVYKNAKSVISQNLSWTHYIHLMRLENEDERNFILAPNTKYLSRIFNHPPV